AKGDVFLLGKNLAHVFRSENRENKDKSTDNQARALSVFFDLDQFKDLLHKLPEAHDVLHLLDNSKFGIKTSIKEDSNQEKWIMSLRQAEGLDQVVILIKTLLLIAESRSIQYISPQSLPIKDPLDGKRLDQVFDFIQNNFTKSIALGDVASQINMSPSAFCRFFKKKTKRTFTNYLIETRISQACRLLIQEDFTVSETCFESGYNSTSNFHRHFRRITGLSPNEYKRKVLDVD
ncbi:MAG: helix-turn-helix domain-containing protein, partial [Bacteroidales bacterium]|nr:helix-turn-helix domain-containing protein [Bacteroidales bacterium]